MAERYPNPTVRTIPNWQMNPPWSDPQSEAEQEALAQTGLLSGAVDTNRSVSTLLGRFAGDYAANLNRGRG